MIIVINMLFIRDLGEEKRKPGRLVGYELRVDHAYTSSSFLVARRISSLTAATGRSA